MFLFSTIRNHTGAGRALLPIWTLCRCQSAQEIVRYRLEHVGGELPGLAVVPASKVDRHEKASHLSDFISLSKKWEAVQAVIGVLADEFTQLGEEQEASEVEKEDRLINGMGRL